VTPGRRTRWCGRLKPLIRRKETKMNTETYVLSDATMPHWFLKLEEGRFFGIDTPVGHLLLGFLAKESAEVFQNLLRLRGCKLVVAHLATGQVRELCMDAQQEGCLYLAVVPSITVDAVVHLVPLKKVIDCGPGTWFVVDGIHRISWH
jgi:hypothetical protein